MASRRQKMVSDIAFKFLKIVGDRKAVNVESSTDKKCEKNLELVVPCS